MKKRFLALVCSVCLFLALLSLTCAAAEDEITTAVTDAVVEATEEHVADEIVADETDGAYDNESEELPAEDIGNENAAPDQTTDEAEHDIFTRLYEFAMSYRQELVAVAGSAVVVAIETIYERRNKKRSDDTKADVAVIKKDSSGTALGQTSMIDAVNLMIGGYNSMRDSYEKYEGVEDDRNRLIGAVMVQNTALLEILMAVYVNNKNLPQGVKDLVTLRYTNAQKALGDDQELMAIVAAVRDQVNKSVQQDGAETAAETTEDTVAGETEV